MKQAVLLIALLLLVTLVLPCAGAGHWSLAFWRSLPKNEASDNLFVRIWTFDENGNVKGNIPITTTTGTLLATTSSDGRVDFPMSVNNEYQAKVGQSGTTSDISPFMSNGRFPNWGHYSYELGFMYKSDINNPGIFDQSIVGGSVPRLGSTTSNAPFTSSMAYYSYNPSSWACDEAGYALPNWGEHGQTFVANGNRVVCAQFHPTVGGVNNQMTFTVEIRQGGPTGAVIASKTSSVHYNQDWWVVPFGIQDCPVVPGQTYFARLYCPDGFNAYYAKSNFYPSGQAYFRGSSTDVWSVAGNPELKGFIVCATSSPAVRISNVMVTPSTGGAVVNWTTDVPASTKIEYGTSSSYGKTITDPTLSTSHSVNVGQLHANTNYHYKITAGASGYIDGVTSDAVFATVSANPNLLINGGFETGQIAPWVKFGEFQNNVRTDGIGPWCTGKCPVQGVYDVASIISGGTRNGGFYQRITGLTPGATYTAKMTHFTWQQGGADSDCANVLGVDPYGGTDPNGPNVVKTPELSSQDTWATVTMDVTAKSNSMTVFLKAIQRWALVWNTNGFDDIWLTGPAGGSIQQVKANPDGASVAVSGKVVTAIPGQIGAYYVQEPDRQSGIRVEAVSGSANLLQTVTVTGWMTTNTNGEKVIIDAAITPSVSGEAEPIGMINRTVGGSDVSSSIIGATGKQGLNNIGLLVHVWGTVTSTSGTSFYITDGSGDPIKIDASALSSMPTTDDYVIITGICRLEKAGSVYVPYIQLRQNGDWTKKN